MDMDIHMHMLKKLRWRRWWLITERGEAGEDLGKCLVRLRIFMQVHAYAYGYGYPYA